MWIRNEIHRRKDGGVTIKPRFVGWKRKPRRKRRGGCKRGGQDMTNIEQLPRLLTVPEVAELLGVNQGKVPERAGGLRRQPGPGERQKAVRRGTGSMAEMAEGRKQTR